MSRGLRMTRQRRTILSVVETAKQHLDASQLLRGRGESIPRSTESPAIAPSDC